MVIIGWVQTLGLSLVLERFNMFIREETFFETQMKKNFNMLSFKRKIKFKMEFQGLF